MEDVEYESGPEVDFDWDEDKRLANLAKHRIDFVRAQRLFDGQRLYEKPSDRFGEVRFSSTGSLDGRLVTVAWTWRGTTRRLISVRRARNAEERAYRELHEDRVGGDDRPR